MALTPNGFPENHPASIKKELALLQQRAAHGEIKSAGASFLAACSLATQSVHSKIGAVYRSVGHRLGL
jgi:hypothetical protein